MIDLTTINEWQRRGADGLVEPWYTFPALDEINTWDLSDKKVLEFGGGASTVWWNKKALSVTTVEENPEYVKILQEMDYDVDIPKELYLFDNYYDIVIVDNEGNRDYELWQAYDYAKYGGGIIICDNWMQPSVDWMPTQDLVDFYYKFKHKIFKQPGHPDWQTLICWI